MKAGIKVSLYGSRNDDSLVAWKTVIRGIAELVGDSFHFRFYELDDRNDSNRLCDDGRIDIDQSQSTPRATISWINSGQSEKAIQVLNISELTHSLRTVVDEYYNSNTEELEPIKIFVGGDRSQVGKSTVCLGLVGSLLKLGFSPSEIGYIKPATQCEKPQLISKFCKSNGISCVDIGPIVFYSGFTREYLKGNTETAVELLEKARISVDQVGCGKKVVVIDGVGYPAVGSICGVSNADVAKAVNAPVVLVGKKGVGDAVDSFNLNSSFFEAHGVRVLGAIFNRLPSEGFYSREKCRENVQEYFTQYQEDKHVYGFIPELTENVNNLAESTLLEQNNTSTITADEYNRAKQIIDLFYSCVDVQKLLSDAKQSQHTVLSTETMVMATSKRMWKTQRTENTSFMTGRSNERTKRSRLEIQTAAMASGASGA